MIKNSLHPEKRLLTSILVDVLVFAVFLLTFAYFHHVRVKPTAAFAIPAGEESAAPAATFAFPADTPAPETTPEATEVPEESEADSPFAAGDGVSYENTYQSENVSVKVIKKTVGESVCFITDIYVRDITSLKTAVALDYEEFNEGARKNVMQTTELAGHAGAIVALSGDNYVFRQAGRLVIRNGEGLDVQFPIEDDICVLYQDGTMETYGKWSINRETIQTVYDRKPYQAWSFGPMLLDEEGQPKTSFNSSVSKVNPRSAIGYYEPGHYCFVLVDGRQAGYSTGMTLTELSQLFYDLGCKVAYNLDGGDTVALAFGTDLINHPENAVPRSVSDIVYICEPDVSAAAADGLSGEQEPAPADEAAEETPEPAVEGEE